MKSTLKSGVMIEGSNGRLARGAIRGWSMDNIEQGFCEGTALLNNVLAGSVQLLA